MDTIADYTLERPLGSASNGEFFLAAPPPRLNLDVDRVAVKLLVGMTSDESFRRATRELRAFASAQSPYLVTLYDAGADGTTFFYSMEYSALGTLDQPARALTPDEVRRAVAHAARAAHALHEAGVVHRAITPAAILLTDDGGKLSDLGLADVVNPGQTVTSVGGVGSIEYLDPAILLGERASRATDIWSLGATLHKARTGLGLFGELPSEPLAAIRKLLSHPPQIDAALPAEEQTIISRCVSADDRYATAAAFAEDLERLLA